MKKLIKILLIVLTPLSLLGQEINSNKIETKDNHDKNSYVEKMNYFLGERDFKNSLLS